LKGEYWGKGQEDWAVGVRLQEALEFPRILKEC